MRRIIFALPIFVLLSFSLCYSATFYSFGTSHLLFAYGISGDGTTVVGKNNVGYSDADGSRAFKWTKEMGLEFISIVPSSNLNWAEDASYDGSVIVGAAEYGNRIRIATRWTEETDIQLLPYYDESQAFGVSGNGSVVVGVTYPFSFGDSFYGAAFRWTPQNGMTILGSLPDYPSCNGRSISKDGSTIVGYCRTVSAENTNFTSFIWTEENGMTDLGFPSGYIASKISADGFTIAGSFVNSDEAKIFKWSATEGLVDIGAPPGSTEVQMRDLSGDGSIIIGWSDVGSFIWDSEHGIRLLQDALTDQYKLDLTGWNLYDVAAISEDGEVITGTGINSDNAFEVWVVNLADNNEEDPVVEVGGNGGGGGGCFMCCLLP